MSLSILICDDSSFARKQMARSLPADLDAEISFASNGEEALQAINDGKGELLFLDLTMPVLDGFETLKEIRKNDLNSMVVVVSGDVQPEAYEEVIANGALDFIKKPASKEKIREVLTRFGIL